MLSLASEECKAAALRSATFHCPNGKKSCRAGELHEKLPATMERFEMRAQAVLADTRISAGRRQHMRDAYRASVGQVQFRFGYVFEQPWTIWTVRTPDQAKHFRKVYAENLKSLGSRNMDRVADRFCAPQGDLKASFDKFCDHKENRFELKMGLLENNFSKLILGAAV